MESYIFTKAVHLYDKLGVEASEESDSYFDVLLREMSVGYLCEFGYAPCVEVAKKQFELWMAAVDPDSASANPIDEGLRAIFYCTAVKAGGSKASETLRDSLHKYNAQEMQEWNFLMDRYMGTSNSIEQRNIMAGLGCSTDAETLNR